MSDYRIVQVVAPGVSLIEHPTFGRQLWSLSRLTYKHKGDACIACRGPVGNPAYRPMTNLSNRMYRMCIECATKKEPIVLDDVFDKNVTCPWCENKIELETEDEVQDCPVCGSAFHVSDCKENWPPEEDDSVVAE